MRFHRFYVMQTLEVGKEAVVPDADLAHQISRVFRLEPGDTILLFNGSSFDYVSRLISVAENDVRVMITDKKNTCFIAKRNVHLFLSIAKKDSFEWALEKCTEIGVSEFTPVVSERTEKKNIDMRRMESIMKEASEQSGRCSLPLLNPIKAFDEMIQESGLHLFLFHPLGRNFEPDEKTSCTNLAIGPEGGWSDKEVEEAEKAGAKIVTLGKQVLRSETAAVAVSSIILL